MLGSLILQRHFVCSLFCSDFFFFNEAFQFIVLRLIALHTHIYSLCIKYCTVIISLVVLPRSRTKLWIQKIKLIQMWSKSFVMAHCFIATLHVLMQEQVQEFVISLFSIDAGKRQPQKLVCYCRISEAVLSKLNTEIFTLILAMLPFWYSQHYCHICVVKCNKHFKCVHTSMTMLYGHQRVIQHDVKGVGFPSPSCYPNHVMLAL